MPNIRGSARLDNSVLGTYFDGATGAFYKGNSWITSGSRGSAGSAPGALYFSGFDASLSSSIYQNNAHVQQNALCLQMIIKY